MSRISRNYCIRAYRKSTSGSVRFQDVGRAWTRGTLSLPKLNELKLAEAIPEVTRPDQVTLSRDATGRYHVSFAVEVPKSLLPITHRSEWYGKILVAVDRWYPSSKRCSECQYTLDELRLDQRQWTCPRCGFSHDRDVNAARNLLAEGLRQLAGRDDRDLRVDAGDACPEEILVQVLAEEARSGQRNRVRLEQARLS